MTGTEFLAEVMLGIGVVNGRPVTDSRREYARLLAQAMVERMSSEHKGDDA